MKRCYTFWDLFPDTIFLILDLIIGHIKMLLFRSGKNKLFHSLTLSPIKPICWKSKKAIVSLRSVPVVDIRQLCSMIWEQEYILLRDRKVCIIKPGIYWKIGRASCRERGLMEGLAGYVKD